VYEIHWERPNGTEPGTENMSMGNSQIKAKERKEVYQIQKRGIT
jgi:hypothetical protein